MIDEALDALDDDARNRVMTLFTTGLHQAAIVNIGRPETKLFRAVLAFGEGPPRGLLHTRPYQAGGHQTAMNPSLRLSW